jgi:4-amino-4-deoxy-L-arabinose transferase-like glycosyltransferase
MVSPAILDYSSVAAGNARAVGPIVFGTSLIAAWSLMRPLRWFELLVGAWLVASPWLLIKWYEPVGIANAVGVGIALIILAFLGGKTRRNLGGGWRSLITIMPEEERRS